MTASNSSSVMLKLILSRRIPALQMSTSSPPKVSMACCTMRLGAGPARAVVVVRDALAAGGGDLVDDLLRGGLVGALTGAGTAEVVDHDLRALAREQQRLGAADAATCAGDDRDLAVEESHRSTFLCSYESGQRG